MIDLDDTLIKIPQALAHRVARQDDCLYDELLSVGNEALVLAAHSYNGEKGTSAATWLYRKVQFALSSHRHPGRYNSEQRWRKLAVLDDKIGSGDGDSFLDHLADPCNHSDVIDAAETIELVGWLLPRLDEMGRELIKLIYWKGLSCSKAARRLSIDRHNAALCVARALQCARTQLEAQLGGCLP